MSKLYPPSIAGTIPAFTIPQQDGNCQIKVPFNMNRAVSRASVGSIYLKIKSIQNNEILFATKTTDIDWVNLIATFTMTTDAANSKFTIGNSYKLQIAYVGSADNVTGYYSTVGIIKCTREPEVYIENLVTQKEGMNIFLPTYTGVYSQKDLDQTEKVYSYCFTIYDSNGNIFDTSGEQIHNHEYDDEIYESIDTFTPSRVLKEGQNYTLQYTGITTNSLEFASPIYILTQQNTIAPDIKATVQAEMIEEEGYVSIHIVGDPTGKDDEGNPIGETAAAGTFILLRASSEDNYESWFEIQRFALFGTPPSLNEYRDYTVQHGHKYRYALQQYNIENQIYSDKIITNQDVEIKFEHSFLYDGKRQLKIKFDPKISSFKEDVLEQKTDTLGGQYPFFFRNGNVKYKEFPINGLISYWSDEQELFMSLEDLMLDEVSNDTRSRTKQSDIPDKRLRTTNLVNYNVAAERIFKMEVLEWLNNGEIKLFRSPSEGNFIVRLMNCSLTPNDTLNRMIHSFACTAYEVDEYNFKNLGKYGLLNIADPNTNWMRWKTIQIKDFLSDKSIFDVGAVIFEKSNLTIGNELVQSIDLQTPIINHTHLGLYIKLHNKNGFNDENKYLQVLFTYNCIDTASGKLVTEDKEYKFIIKEEDIDKFNNVWKIIDLNNLFTESYTKIATKCQIQIIMNSNSHANIDNIKIYSGIPIDGPTEEWVSIGEEDNIYSIQCENLLPGDQIRLYQDPYDEGQYIKIGVTGAYFAEFRKPIHKVEIQKQVNTKGDIITSTEGQITISYYSNSLSPFDQYFAIENRDIPIKQFIGSNDNKDIIDLLEDIKHRVNKYYFAHFVKRDIVDFNDYNIQAKEDFNALTVYKIENKYYDGQTLNLNNKPDSLLTNYSEIVTIDNSTLDLSDIVEYEFKPEGTPSIILSDGVVADISVQYREIVYNIEEEARIESEKYKANPSGKDTRSNFTKLYDLYHDAEDEVWEIITTPFKKGKVEYEQELANAKQYRDAAYLVYITQLQEELSKGVK